MRLVTLPQALLTITRYRPSRPPPARTRSQAVRTSRHFRGITSANTTGPSAGNSHAATSAALRKPAIGCGSIGTVGGSQASMPMERSATRRSSSRRRASIVR